MISVEFGELGELSVDAAVRAVSTHLEPITPIARDLGRRAGPKVLEQLAAQGSFPVGGAVITSGGECAATFLIHVVIQSTEEPISVSGVRRALLNGLRRAAHFGVESLAVPPVGMGAGNLEADEAAAALAEALKDARAEGLPGTVRVVVASDYERSAFEFGLRTAGFEVESPGSDDA